MTGKETKQAELEQHEIILYPLITEKAVGMIETQNKLSFIVNKRTNKTAIKNAVEEIYNVEIDGIKIVNDQKGRKKAIVKLNKKFKAEDIATKLGVL